MPTKKSTRKQAAKAKSAKKKAPAARKTAPAARKKAPAAKRATPAAYAAATPTTDQEAMETVLKAGTQAATKGCEQAFAIAQEQAEQASQTLFRRYDDVASFGKGNVDACVLSGTVFARGCESMSRELMSIAQSALEVHVANSKALFGATSVRELIDLQTEFSRRQLDSLLAESAKLTELSLALASETIEPIQARLNATVETLTKPRAA